jgi:hypothetical protein
MASAGGPRESRPIPFVAQHHLRAFRHKGFWLISLPLVTDTMTKASPDQ